VHSLQRDFWAERRAVYSSACAGLNVPVDGYVRAAMENKEIGKLDRKERR
jgi:hypothetical protein